MTQEAKQLRRLKIEVIHKLRQIHKLKQLKFRNKHRKGVNYGAVFMPKG